MVTMLNANPENWSFDLFTEPISGLRRAAPAGWIEGGMELRTALYVELCLSDLDCESRCHSADSAIWAKILPSWGSPRQCQGHWSTECTLNSRGVGQNLWLND